MNMHTERLTALQDKYLSASNEKRGDEPEELKILKTHYLEDPPYPALYYREILLLHFHQKAEAI